MAVTSIEIARAAGVSQMTVSRVFSGKAAVSDRMRRRVLDAAERLNYQPNLMASALRSGETRSVGVLWSLGRPGAEGVVREIAVRLARRGYVTFMADCLSDPSILSETLAGFAGRGVEGIVLQADQNLLANAEVVGHFGKFKAVVAVADKPLDTPIQPPVDVVAHDVDRLIAEIVDHFVRCGRKRICLAGELKSNREKVEPFFQRLRHHGLSTEAALIPVDHPGRAFETIGCFREAFDAYFSQHALCDALLAVSDEGATAALMWMREQGVAVPDQVALCGFNNLSLLEGMTPPLATVDWHLDRMVEVLTRLLMERMEETGRPSRYELQGMSFVWRASAGTPAGIVEPVRSTREGVNDGNGQR